MSVFTGYWSERAGKAEYWQDDAAATLDRLEARYGHLMGGDDRYALERLRAAHRGLQADRLRALPAGHTHAGQLTSGGVNSLY